MLILTILIASIDTRRLATLGDPGVRPDPITGKPVYTYTAPVTRTYPNIIVRIPHRSSRLVNANIYGKYPPVYDTQ